MRTFFALICASFFIGFGPCGSSVSGPIQYGGYVKNIATNEILTGYTMTVESATGLDDVDIDDTTGKFEFSLPVGADYLITITKEGFRTFASTNRWSPASTQDNTINEEQSFLYVAPLVPLTLTSPAVTGTVLDATKGSAVSSGAFRVVATGLESGFQGSLYSDGSVIATQGVRFWLADGGVVSGAISSGTFTIPASALLPGYTYSVTVYGVSGYRDQKFALTLATTDINDAKHVTMEMVPYTQFATPTLIAQSTLGAGGLVIPLSSDRVITFTFDRDITLFKNALKNLGSDDGLLTVVTADSDADASTTSTTLGVETVAAGGFSSRVSVAASGNKVTITLASDSTLISGTIDTDDDLSYTLSATLLNGILIRDANSSADNFITLNSLTPSTTVLIRATLPP